MYFTDSVASRLKPTQRQELAVEMLSKEKPVSQIAREEKVSRPFLYRNQKAEFAVKV